MKAALLFALIVLVIAPDLVSTESGLKGDGANPTSVKRDPALQAILDKAGAYAKQYRRSCRDLVAEEKMTQREFDKKGKVKDQRSFLSDYFFVTLPSDPSSVMEVRDIKEIDGKPVRRKERGLLELFEKKSSSAGEEAERLAKESTKYNLGRKRYTNMVNFGLFFLLPEYQGKIAYQCVTSQGALQDDVIVLQFREETEQTALRAVTPFGRYPIPSSGQIWLTLREARVLKIEFSFREDQKFYSVAGRYVSEYQAGSDGLLVPVHFQEYLYQITPVDQGFPIPKDRSGGRVSSPKEESLRVILQSEATYSNFRRFSTDVKILPEATPIGPEDSRPK